MTMDDKKETFVPITYDREQYKRMTERPSHLVTSDRTK